MTKKNKIQSKWFQIWALEWLLCAHEIMRVGYASFVSFINGIISVDLYVYRLLCARLFNKLLLRNCRKKLWIFLSPRQHHLHHSLRFERSLLVWQSPTQIDQLVKGNCNWFTLFFTLLELFFFSAFSFRFF